MTKKNKKPDAPWNEDEVEAELAAGSADGNPADEVRNEDRNDDDENVREKRESAAEAHREREATGRPPHGKKL